MPRMMCCCSAIAFGDPCDNCAGGDHDGCRNPVDPAALKPPDVERKTERITVDTSAELTEHLLRCQSEKAELHLKIERLEHALELSHLGGEGVFIAYEPSPNIGAVAVFREEIDQLRFALNHYMQVATLPYGVLLLDYLEGEKEKQGENNV